MNLAALNTSLLFCNIAENKLLATCPSLAPPIFQIMIYMLGCLCLEEVLQYVITEEAGTGNHREAPPGGLTQLKTRI